MLYLKALFIILQTIAFGSDSHHFNVSLLGGAVFFPGHLPSSSSHAPQGPKAAYKVSAAYLFENHFELGAELGMAGSNPTFGLDLNYYFTQNLFVGMAGVFKMTPHRTYEYIGGKVGYDFPITHKLNIGPEVLYLYNVSGRIEMLETLGAVKYFF